MTFAASGTIIQSQATTFSLTPHAVGNIILFSVTGNSTSSVPSSMSSSNVTWAKLGTAGTTDSGSPFNPSTAQVFIGTVTATSAATVTIAWTGTTPATIQCAGQEFSSTVGASSVTLDVQATLNADTGTNAWPSLTPGHGAGELYFGYALDNGTALAGSTTGYTYQTEANGNGMAYNVSCPNAATHPVWGDVGQTFGVMLLVYEASAAVSGTVQRRATVPVPRRILARVVWARIAGQQAGQLPAPRQLPALPPRRRLARAFVQFIPVRIVNATPPAPVGGTVQPRATVLVPRRVPGRGFWRGSAVPGMSGLAPAQQYRTPPRRTLVRAYAQFVPVRTVNATAAGVAVPAPRQLPAAPRRKPARAYIQFRSVLGANAVTGGGPVLAVDVESRLIRRYRRMLHRHGLAAEWEPEVSMLAAPVAFEVPPGWPGTWPVAPAEPEPEPEPEPVQSPSALAPKWRPVYTRPPKIVRARHVPRDAMMPVWRKTG